jgi:dipeptidyl aminopeptidase/acylaminoacyl peptidase
MRLTLVFLLALLAACQQKVAPEVEVEKVKATDEVVSLPFGSWPSPITAESLVEGSRSLHTLYHDNGYLYWVEGRPQEGGRNTIMRWRAGSDPEEILPAPWNARTRIQEYGGRSILVAQGNIWFSNFSDQRLYRLEPGKDPVALTPEDAPLRYGACELDQQRNRLICIREDHRPLEEPRNTLVALPLDGENEGQVLYEGSDFVSAPALSPDGKRIAFVTWDHPNMPWDNTALRSASFDAAGQLTALVEHNPGSSESIADPQWSADNQLHAVSDRSDWWALYRVDGESFEALEFPLTEAEVGGPAWSIGGHSYRFLADGRIAAKISRWGVYQLYILDPARGSAQLLELGSASVSDVLPVDDLLYVVHSPEQRPTELLATDAEGARALVIRKSRDNSPAPEWVPRYQQVSFPTAGGATAYGIYYPPTNPQVRAPDSGAPPLLVFVHGGPTGLSTPDYSPGKQYWTSRGFAILDINYRGSTGYGRQYRQALYGQWGIADVEDVVAGARWAAGQGMADPDMLIIRGGSAGGYTTLAAHAFHATFAAGASYFGVSDIEALAQETHKFESRYLDQLIGPYPERRDLYVERSPIHHLEGFDAPLLLLQGLEDKVVPPNQSEMIFEALKSRGVPTAYLAFEGEGHGFRKSENQVRALQAEYYFYAQVLGFATAEELPPVAIIGLGPDSASSPR